MNEFEEVVTECYQKANERLTSLLKESQDKIYRVNVLLTIICVLLSFSFILGMVLFYFNNQKWIEVFNSYEYETIAYEQDGEGSNAINHGEGDINIGAEIDN